MWKQTCIDCSLKLANPFCGIEINSSPKNYLQVLHTGQYVFPVRMKLLGNRESRVRFTSLLVILWCSWLVWFMPSLQQREIEAEVKCNLLVLLLYVLNLLQGSCHKYNSVQNQWKLLYDKHMESPIFGIPLSHILSRGRYSDNRNYQKYDAAP